MTLKQRFPPLCTRLLFVVNTLTVFLSFCYIYKYFVRQLKVFPPSFCHFCACEMSPGSGHLITWMDPSVGHLKGILAWVGGNLNNNFQKSQMPGGLPGGGMLKLRFDRYIMHINWVSSTELKAEIKSKLSLFVSAEKGESPQILLNLKKMLLILAKNSQWNVLNLNNFCLMKWIFFSSKL